MLFLFVGQSSGCGRVLGNFKILLFLEKERGEGREKEGVKHPCVVAPCAPLLGGSGPPPRHVPDWESNWRPFGLQADSQSTEPHQPGQ